ncbi:hypothetical protein [Consotaella salsifontis]|uniref:Uncharacterized protein n=1 Tax=Consotaella salsifontis TaxID=1365950 RepID=A0A1T4R5A9_9HYPH|nr:hypothetical protein [Consotaella salsifontis]SKA11133.1 hypothetical protein SAMN05428963_10633 [Consotaella salsifontis]
MRANNLHRRAFLGGAASIPVIVTVPAVALASEPDPLLELIREYRRQLAVFNASDAETDEEMDALADETFNPPYDELVWNAPQATTEEGAIEALRLANEYEHFGDPDMMRSLIGAALPYFEGAAS